MRGQPSKDLILIFVDTSLVMSFDPICWENGKRFDFDVPISFGQEWRYENMDFLAKMGGKCLCQETIGGAFCPTTGDNRWSKRKSERFPTEQSPIREGGIFAIFRSRHFFPSFFWKFYTPRCMNRISHLAPMSFLETVKWLWPECQIDHPANCGIWALSHFIFAITQYQEFFMIFFLLFDSSFFLFVIIISWCFFHFSTADKRRLSEFDLFYMRLLLGHETPLPAMTTLTKSQTKKTSKVWK